MRRGLGAPCRSNGGPGSPSRCLVSARGGRRPWPSRPILAAWRSLASRPTAIDADQLATVVDLLGLPWDEVFAGLAETIEDLLARDKKPAPFAAAAIATQVFVLRPDAELLCWWLADLVLAQKLRWPTPVPLLMAQILAPAFRVEGGRGKRIRPGGEGFERAVCLALAQSAADACRLAGEIARRAERLFAVAPKLRAKGAGEAIQKLLDNDAVPGSLTTKNLSRFGARRLFERLQKFEAVRELSGRSAFRLYGL